MNTKDQTAREKRRPINLLNFQDIPEYTETQIHDAFKLIRDKRYLVCSNIVGNLRSIPWLFVENGCFLKAALAKRLLDENGFPEIRKLFVFGNFKFKSRWSLNGFITLKDHVAVATRVNNDIYILDPSICYDKPLLLADWIAILTSESDSNFIEASICSPLTVGHNSNCCEHDPKNEVGIKINVTLTIEYFTMEFLAKEYKLIVSLGENPTDILSIV